MGVSDVIIGVLTEEMRVPDGGTLDLGPLIHPRVEPEVAFLLSGVHGHRVLSGTVVRAGAATAAVPLPQGAHVTAAIDGLGTVSLTTAG